jgi:hypothetical protein
VQKTLSQWHVHYKAAIQELSKIFNLLEISEYYKTPEQFAKVLDQWEKKWSQPPELHEVSSNESILYLGKT